LIKKIIFLVFISKKNLDTINQVILIGGNNDKI